MLAFLIVSLPGITVRKSRPILWGVNARFGSWIA
jgi:hypothetical protein